MRRYLVIIHYEISASLRQVKEVLPNSTIIYIALMMWFCISYAVFGVTKLLDGNERDIQIVFFVLSMILGWTSINKALVKQTSLKERLVSIKSFPINYKAISYIKKKKICFPFFVIFTIFSTILILANWLVDLNLIEKVGLLIIYEIYFLICQDFHIQAIIKERENFTNICFVAIQVLMMIAIKTKYVDYYTPAFLWVTLSIGLALFVLEQIYIYIHGDFGNEINEVNISYNVPNSKNFVFRRDLLAILGDSFRRNTLIATGLFVPLLFIVLAKVTMLGKEYPWVSYMLLVLFYNSTIADLLNQSFCMGREKRMLTHYIMSGFPIYKIQLLRLKWINAFTSICMLYFFALSFISIKIAIAERAACLIISLFVGFLINGISAYHSIKYTSYDNELKTPDFFQSILSYVIKMMVYLFIMIGSVFIQYNQYNSDKQIVWFLIIIVILLLLNCFYVLKIKADNLTYYGDYYHECKRE